MCYKHQVHLVMMNRCRVICGHELAWGWTCYTRVWYHITHCQVCFRRVTMSHLYRYHERHGRVYLSLRLRGLGGSWGSNWAIPTTPYWAIWSKLRPCFIFFKNFFRATLGAKATKWAMLSSSSGFFGSLKNFSGKNFRKTEGSLRQPLATMVFA